MCNRQLFIYAENEPIIYGREMIKLYYKVHINYDIEPFKEIGYKK
jgi:hypothetical protein